MCFSVQVSAVGVASEWGVWPLLGVRVPHNATVEPLLTLHNPTDQTIQVTLLAASIHVGNYNFTCKYLCML